jgi:ribonucrease Y
MPEILNWLIITALVATIAYLSLKKNKTKVLQVDASKLVQLEEEKASLQGKLNSALTKEKYDSELEKAIEKVREEKQAQLEELKQELRERFTEKENDLKTTITKKYELEAQAVLLQSQKEASDRLLEVEKQDQENRSRILLLQEKIEAKETILDERSLQLEQKRNEVDDIKEKLRVIKQDLEKAKEQIEKDRQIQENSYQEKIAKIAGITPSEAQDLVMSKAKDDMGIDLINLQHKLLEAAEEDANFKARQITALAVQRCSSEVANEFTLTTIKLADDDVKGRIIGKQGRNIQWLEKTLGVEIVVDETPEVVSISGFNSIRRHIAKRTLEMLLADGRIHPSSIESFYKKAQAEVADEIAASGKWAVEELGIYDFPPKLIRIIGRLKFRTSYGQNMLKHSVEMAKLAELLAVELNKAFPSRDKINLDIVKKGALLHDIGKALDQEIEGNHVDLGEKVCDTFGLDWKIRKCVSSHHNEEYNDPEHGFCIEAVVVDACDNISGGRIGARKETAEAYFQRIESLEKIAESTPGVSKSWIMRGNRELWVFFDTEKIKPSKMHDITTKIANRIQTEMTYPGEIKVIGLWEDRAVEWAS